ncbi:MAG: Tab2/Atab2 family RNA-binding protein [Leptolyngbyaceae cyanobacterium bins.59]|nr:Tab2/Atab2 family RNA-binding protein [Leptolyngbyaceae cyanobacterium bins.59]
MILWQADFYRRPLQDATQQPLWELLLCTPDRTFEWVVWCPQSKANADWLTSQIQAAAGDRLPDRIQVFRPQSLGLLETACQPLGITVEPTRQTSALKQWLEERVNIYPTLPEFTQQPYQPFQLDRPPPMPLPEQLWGDRWRFASLPAPEIESGFRGRPIPILEMPESRLPVNLGIASTMKVPGIVIDGGRQAMRLARWLAQVHPVSIHSIPGAPDGLILEAGLIDRWVVATYDDSEVRTAAQLYEQRKQAAQGLHFLLVQPDDSGVTYSGFWLLQDF